MLGAGFLAGGPALAQESPEGNSSSAPTSHEFRISDSNVTPTAAAEGVEIAFNHEENQVILSGTFHSSSCFNPDLESAVYSVQNDTLTVRLDESASIEGVDCTAAIETENYTATFDVGDLPGTVRVVHYDQVVATETEETSDGIEDSLQGSVFTEFRTSSAVGPSTGVGSADVMIDDENDEVVVDGTVIAPNGCTDADLKSATHHAQNDTLLITIGTYFYADGFGCPSATQPINYTGEFSISDEVESVKVRHAEPTDTGYTTVETVERDGGPAALPGLSERPTDLNGDGHYEDVNGNGDADFDDIVELFQHFTADAVQDSPEAFDFNENERLDFNDVVRLFQTI